MPPPRLMTGSERRLLDPQGALKLTERFVDRIASRYVYPRLFGIWSPYSWLLPRMLCVSETSLSPDCWPRGLEPLKILLLTDIHAGPFLRPGVLARILEDLMALEPDLVALGGDVVTGQAADLDDFLEGFAPLASAPLGAWFSFGNHDYFGADAGEVRAKLASVGITTLRNESVVLRHGGGRFVLGGIDDWVLGEVDWERLVEKDGSPHVLLSHNPDAFYEAERRGIGLTLSGHTHGGQIRLASGRPIVRQSRYCLDEGVFRFEKGLLVVSRGMGASGIPWRSGADPEAVLVTVRSG